MHTFHHYYLTSHIARKPGRDVYLAYAVNQPEQRVVLKIFDADCLMSTANLHAVQLLSQRLQLLKHPGIAAPIIVGIAEDKPYAVSAYLPDGSLRQYLTQHSSEPLSIDKAIAIVLQVSEAVSFAHSQGIVHQHIRPENIMLHKQEEWLLTDFSLGTVIDETRTEDKSDGRVVSYTAPEQFAGVVDPANDQYALGCLLYELITGTVPFKVNGQSGSTQRSGFTVPVAPTLLMPSLPLAVETVLLRALEASPQKRYRDVAAFRTALKIAAKPAEIPALPFARLDSDHRRGGASLQEAQTVFTSELALDEDLPDESFLNDVPLEAIAQKSHFDEERDLSFQDTKPDVLAGSEEALAVAPADNDVPTQAFGSEPHSTITTQPKTPGIILPVQAKAQAVNRPLLLAKKRRSWPLLALAVGLVLIVVMLTQVFNPGTLGTVSNVPATPTTSAPTSIVPNHDPLASPTSISINQNKPTVAAKPKPTSTPKPTPTVRPTQTAQPTSPPVAVIYPTATPKPTPTPVANVSASYEAESSLNTRAANLKEFTCSLCSGGLRIGWVYGADTLLFNDITSRTRGSYTLSVYYYNSVPNRVTQLFVSVNGNANVEVGLQVATVDCCNYAPYVGSITITLPAGNNNIRLSNPNGPAPDIDRIVVNPS